MVECGWTSPEAVSACLPIIQAWLKTVGDFVSVGSAAIITFLFGYVLRLRRKRAELNALLREREARVSNAEEAQRQFDARIDHATDQRKALEVKVAGLNDDVRLLSEAVKSNAKAAETVHDTLELAGSGDTAFWRRPPLPLHDNGLPLHLRTHCPTLMFANQKGGVGKSTLVANLSAYFAAKGFNVLAVDLDYQGTLTNQMRLEKYGPAGPPPTSTPPIDAKAVLRQPFRKADWARSEVDHAIITATQAIPPVDATIPAGRLCFLANDYELSQVERKVEYSWVLNTLEDDPRYRLASFLAHAAGLLALDYILIDAPPRFTLGFINGLAASTHLFVPTIVDPPSTRAVEAFARQFADLAPRLNPGIRWSGIIGTMTMGNTSRLPQIARPLAGSTEYAASNRIPDAGPFFYDATVPHSIQIPRAAEFGIPYLQSDTVRASEVIQTLGDHILAVVNPNGTRAASSIASEVERASTA